MHELTDFVKQAQRFSKAIAAGVGSVLGALTSVSFELGVELIPAEAQNVVVFVIAALTAFATWAVPNFTPDGK
jgi:hypothetical protein